MNEAPKKIWVDAELDVYGYKEQGTQLYIRADIVDELVEALTVFLKLHDNKVDIAEAWETSMEEARAALKKLEDV